MTEKYYLITSQYNQCAAGTVLRLNGKRITDIQKNNEYKFVDGIPSQWINISKDEAFYLSKIDINDRINFKERNLFHYLNHLSINDKCYYTLDRLKTICTINHKSSKMDGVYYHVSFGSGNVRLVPLYQLQLIDEMEIRNRVPEPGTDTSSIHNEQSNSNNNNNFQESKSMINTDSSARDSCHHVNFKDQCSSENQLNKRNNIFNTTNQASSDHNKTFIQSCSEKFLHTSSDNQYPNKDLSSNHTHNSNKQFGDCQNKLDNKQGTEKENSNNNRACDGRFLKQSQNHENKNYNFNKQQNYRNERNYRGQTDKIKSYGKQDNLRNNADKNIYCEEMDMDVINPNSIKDIVPHKKMTGYLIYRYHDEVFPQKVHWLGLVDGILSFGCILHYNFRYGTNGFFGNKKCFECSDKRGILVHADRPCLSGNPHNSLRFTDEISIVEDSICCIEEFKENLKFPLNKPIIVEISKTRKMVKCIWAGRANGTEVIGIVSSKQESSGTNGTFCKVKLFHCSDKTGLLFESKMLKYVPNIEFIRMIYLPSNYDILSLNKDTNVDSVGRLIYVKDDPVIYGRIRFVIRLLDYVLAAIELDEHNLQNNISLLDALYYDTIIPQRHAVLVNISSIDIFKDPLRYIENSRMVDETSVKVTETYQSDKFKSGDSVTFYKGNTEIIGHITGFNLLNNVCCVSVREINNFENFHIVEDGVKKISVDNLFASVNNFSNTSINNGERSEYDQKPNRSGIIEQEICEHMSENNNPVLNEGIHQKYSGSEMNDLDQTNFSNDIYFNGEVKLPFDQCCNMNIVGKYGHVWDNLCFYGKIMLGIVLMEVPLLAIQIAFDSFSKRSIERKSVKLYENESGLHTLILVKESHVIISNEPYTCKDRCHIFSDEASGRPHRDKEGRLISVDDIVKYDIENETLYGRVVLFEVLNDIGQVGFVNTISNNGNSDLIYIEEGKLTVVQVDDSLTKYLDDVIIDPRSIVTLTEVKEDNIRSDNEVEFQLKVLKKKLIGRFRDILEVNGSPSVLVELKENPKDINLTEYIINENKLFKEVYKLNGITVIVKRCFVNFKKPLTYLQNNVTIFKPDNIQDISQSNSDDRIITFKCNRCIIVTRLLWHGCIDGEMYLGCEMNERFQNGTNGTFAKRKLFDCANGKGVLIPQNTIDDCCFNTGKHKTLTRLSDGRIKGSSVCCAVPSTFESKLSLGEKVMKNYHNKYFYGKCRWFGLVNNVKVIGVEIIQCHKYEGDELINKMSLFQSQLNTAALFYAEDLISDSIGQYYCSRNNITCIDAANIKSISDAELSKKMIIFKFNRKNVVFDVRWKGVVNGANCIGCQLDNKCECGTNGEFAEDRWFECEDKRGFFIPTKYLTESCEYTKHHKEPNKYCYGSINPDSICCTDSLLKVTRWPQLRVGGKLKYRKGFSGEKIIGNCKWLGLVNGFECIGANMKTEVHYNAKGIFSFTRLFKCKDGQGVIFTTEDVEHDIEGQKLHFVMDKFVDVTKLWKVKKDYHKGTTDLKIDTYVSTFVNEGGRQDVLHGELKWIGRINGEDCAGIDLEYERSYGMNGVLNDKCKFTCLARHGVVTTIDNVRSYNDDLRITLTKDGLIDADKYMICNEINDQKYLKERDVSKNRPVFVYMNSTDKISGRKKGILRWCGTMNKEAVAVVELDQDYDHGTNGRFWRCQLIKCCDKRAIAVKWEKISKYIPFEASEIPIDERIFTEIDINSAVKHYSAHNNEIKDLFGTVKWSGTDEDGQYLYGIELDDRFEKGTNGQFKEQRLFNCRDMHGILVPIKVVVPDVRFVQRELKEEDLPESKVSNSCQYAIPARSWIGEHYGIQGNANSCYFDSSIFALFSKSDVLDFMISFKLNATESNEITKKFREIMSEKIVYPLREFGLVSFHRTEEMRIVIRKYGPKFEEMTKHETDMENVSALLANLCPNEQLLRLTTFKNPQNMTKNKCMFLQLFVLLDRRVPYMSSQQMLDLSMVQNEIMFDLPPTCLIMQAPRDARGINCYGKVLPSQVIEISKLCYQSYKSCKSCNSIAKWQCKRCLELSLQIVDAQFCNDHKCQHEDIVQIPDSTLNSRSEFQMQLKAIICIKRAHFVAYVKEDDFNNEWVFFDSMSTQNYTNNYSVPKVSKSSSVTKFLGLDEDSMQDQLTTYIPQELERVVNDSYIFVYHNSAMTCY